MPTTAQLIAATVKARGVRRVFGLPGGEVAEVLGACAAVGLDFVLTRHENAACLMAIATGELTRQPGVVLATLGPGATNLVNGVANAFLERAPLVAISAQLPTTLAPVLPHQRIELEQLFRPITKWSHTLTGTDTAATVHRALSLAAEGRPGPVYLSLPSDVARREEPAAAAGATAAEGSGPPPALDDALAMLAGARRPIALVGIGANPATLQPALLRWLDAARMPVAVTPKAKGLVPEEHPWFLATCAGMAGDRLVSEMLATADLLVGIGFDPVEAIRPFYAERPFLSISAYPVADREFRPTLEVVTDPTRALDALRPQARPNTEWRSQDVAAFRRRLAALLVPSSGAGGLSPASVIARLRALAPADTILTVDTGAHKLLAGQLWRCHEPDTYFVSHGLSTMGSALPAAIGLKLERPARPVLALTGDGGMAMVLGELETAARLGVPVIVVVLSDGALHLIRMHQERKGFAAEGVDFTGIDFAGIARGFGARGYPVSRLEELEPAMAAALQADRPTVIDVAVDPSDYERMI